MTVISCDPGKNGATCWQCIQPLDVAFAKAAPDTRRGYIDLMRQIVNRHPENCVAYIEKISGFIPDGGASMMFEFGRNVERVGCILETLGVRIIEVTPQTWQKSLCLGKIGRKRVEPGMSKDEAKAIKAANARAKVEWKTKLKEEAQRRFPGIPVTLRTADSLLILSYAIQCERMGFVPSREELPFSTT